RARAKAPGRARRRTHRAGAPRAQGPCGAGQKRGCAVAADPEGCEREIERWQGWRMSASWFETRRASGAPHHEGLVFRRETRPHPEETAKGGRLEGWATKGLPAGFCLKCD